MQSIHAFVDSSYAFHNATSRARGPRTRYVMPQQQEQQQQPQQRNLPLSSQLARKREWNRGPLTDLFPRLPDFILERLLDLIISKGFTYNLSHSKLSNAKRYTAIVIAHCRHAHSDYDQLLLRDRLERFEARRRTAERVWKVLREWSPWERDNEVLERCFRATLVPPEERDESWDPMVRFFFVSFFCFFYFHVLFSLGIDGDDAFFVAQYIVMGVGLTSSRTWMKNPTSRTPWISIESNDDGSKLVCTLSIHNVSRCTKATVAPASCKKECKLRKLILQYESPNRTLESSAHAILRTGLLHLRHHLGPQCTCCTPLIAGPPLPPCLCLS